MHVKRRLFNLLAVLSLLPGLATALLWLRSAGADDQWRLAVHDPGVWKSVIVDSRRGEISLVLGSVTYWSLADPVPHHLELTHSATKIAGGVTTAAAPPTYFGFGFDHNSPTAPPGEVYQVRTVLFPHWLLLLPAVAVGMRLSWMRFAPKRWAQPD